MNSSLVLKHQSQSSLGEAYLKLQLDSQTAAVLSVTDAQRVLVVPAKQITPIPNMPQCVLGLLNQRSRVCWTVDLPQLLELEAIAPDVKKYSVIVINVDTLPLGLAVQNVQGLVRFSEDVIQSAEGKVATQLAAYLQGWILHRNEVLWLLDAQAIINSPLFNPRS